MINFLIDNEENIHETFVNRNLYSPKIVQLPFNQSLKRKVVVRQVNSNDQNLSEYVRVYVKGAPEYVIPLCTQILDSDIQPQELTDDDQIHLLTTTASEEMAQKELKTLTYAFKEVKLEDL